MSEELKAGRDLDALIAERVFGLVQCQGLRHDGLFPNTYCYANPASPTQGAEVREYSTRVEDAWEVVERMADGWYIEIRNYIRPIIGVDGFIDESTPDRMFWLVTIERVGPSDKEYSEEAVTPALAICLAALKAIAASSLLEDSKNG